jgi:hypothetical protein
MFVVLWCVVPPRHRVIKCRLGWLLEGLSNTLGGVAALLPQEPRLEVAAVLLKEAVLAVDRVLLDGGPCRWWVGAPAACPGEEAFSFVML